MKRIAFLLLAFLVMAALIVPEAMAQSPQMWVTNTPIRLKAPSLILFGGSISITYSSPSATEIDMTDYTGGPLSIKPNILLDTGTWSVDMYVSNDSAPNSGTGYYALTYREESKAAGGMTWVQTPYTITTTAGAHRTYRIDNIRAKFIKFVPTLSGSSSGYFTFVRSK